jgi:hypothetical protein
MGAKPAESPSESIAGSLLGGNVVPDITCVSFVPKAQRGKLRHVLMTEDTGELRWKERKTLFGSEFYFSGPSRLVMRTHAYVSYWLAATKTADQSTDRHAA